jgi:hypothetical protein
MERPSRVIWGYRLFLGFAQSAPLKVPLTFVCIPHCTVLVLQVNLYMIVDKDKRNEYKKVKKKTANIYTNIRLQ